MNFKVLNRTTENNLDPNLKKALISVDVKQRAFYLNSRACEKLGVWIGDYIDFLVLDSNYMIAKSSAPHGYKLTKGQKSNYTGEYITCRIVSTVATRVMKEHYNMRENRLNFYLIRTEHEYKSNPVFEMIKTTLK